MARPAVLTVADTIARSFLKSVETRGDRPAIREKKFGIWQPTSWREWLQISKDIAFGLHASGFRPGDVASIIANAVPEWVYADMGILCAGGVSSGIYPTDSSSQVEYLINDSSTKVIFAEDEEQLDKILSCRSRCPTLQKIFVFDMEGLSGFTDPMVLSLAEFMALGRNHEQGNDTLWDEMIGSRSAGDLAILVYTSGTTGPPKGAMHSNRSVTHQMRHANDLFPSTDAEERLVFLPLCHVAERVGGYYISVALGSVMNFAESPETVPDNLREVQPTVFLAVPRIWEKFYSSITIALKDATPLQQWVYRRAISVGYRNQPEKTAETIDSRGWLHTGDVGAIDNEGFVKITDRMRDIIITAGGKNITPSEIENQLKFSPYISDAVVIGDKRPYLTCLLMIDQENVEKYAQDHDIPFTNYASLCRAPEIQDLIQREIEAVNVNFARVETIKKFYLIERQLTPEDEELTPTMKLKRSFVTKRYAAEIDAMYGG